MRTEHRLAPQYLLQGVYPIRSPHPPPSQIYPLVQKLACSVLVAEFHRYEDDRVFDLLRGDPEWRKKERPMLGCKPSRRQDLDQMEDREQERVGS